MRVCASVLVCSLVLFSVVSLIMRKLFNVCLPVGMGRGCEAVIAEREKANEKGGEPDRHSCSCSSDTPVMTPTFPQPAPLHSTTFLRDLSTTVTSAVCVWRGGT